MRGQKEVTVLKVTTGELLVFKNMTPPEAVRNAFVREALWGISVPTQSLRVEMVKRDECGRAYFGDYIAID